MQILFNDFLIIGATRYSNHNIPSWSYSNYTANKTGVDGSGTLNGLKKVFLHLRAELLLSESRRNIRNGILGKSAIFFFIR